MSAVERLSYLVIGFVTTLGFAMACAPGAAAEVRPTSPRETVAAKFSAVNRHAIAEIEAFYAPDAIIIASDFCAPRGKVDVARTYHSLLAVISGLSVEVQEYLASGDTVGVRYVVRGSYQGKAVAVPIMNFFTVRNGLIVRDEGIFETGQRPCTR